jgi:glycosyltransferase involved in cell wall biosynthesis
MKICVISNLYEPYARGGAEKVAKAMAEGLAGEGNEVTVISTRPLAGLDVRRDNNFTVCRFKPMNLFYYLDDYKHSAPVRLVWHLLDMFNLHSYFVCKKLLKEVRPDLVITHNLKGLGYLIPLAIRQLKLKHCHVLHDVQLAVPSGLIIKDHENDFIVNGFMTKAYEKICRKLFASPSIVVSPSNWLLEFYASRGFFPASKQTVMRNPLLMEISDGSVQPKKEFTKKYLFIGQLEEHKGIRWLADVWKNPTFASSELRVAGTGSLKPDTISDSERVRFLGKLNEQELIDNLRQVDFLILPSLCYENSPTVIQLAMACGVPVIAADIGGAAELVEHGKTGFVFESGNEASLSAIFDKVRALKIEDYSQMQSECVKVSAYFTLKKYLKELTEL